MMITRNVILDLLPLYFADEVNADTRILVEEYLDSNPEFAVWVEASKALKLTDEIPIPLTKEDKMEAYKEAKQLMFRRTLIVAALISVAVLACAGLSILAFFTMSI